TKALEAWAKWWTENSKSINLARVDLNRREMGYYLVVEQYGIRGSGRVIELDSTGKARWEIANLQTPYDAQVLDGSRVLVVEQQQRVTERDLKGNIVGLNQTYPNVFHAQRLRNGDTFVACRNQLLIVDAKGNQKFTHNYN